MTSKGPNSMTVLTVTSPMSYMEKSYEAGAWRPFYVHGGTSVHEPVTASRVTNEISLFVVLYNHSILHRYSNDPTTWLNVNIGGECVGPPSVSRRGNGGIIDVFHVGRDHAVYHKYWDGTTWTPPGTTWTKVGGKIQHIPTSVSWGPDHIALFAVGTDSALFQANWSSKSGWMTWNRLGGEWMGRPKAVSDKPGNIDVFGVNYDSRLNHLSHRSSRWASIVQMDGTWKSTPTTVSWGPDRVDVLAVGTDNSTYHIFWDGSKWSGWTSLGGLTCKNPKAVTRSVGNLSLFMVGVSGILYQKSLQRNGSWDANWVAWADQTSLSEAG